MPPLLIAAITPDEPGFSALRAESQAQNLNMLRRLAENWQNGENRFNAPGEKLLGAFAYGQAAFVIYTSANATVDRGSGISCWSRLSPIPVLALIFSTPMRRQRPGRFMKIWGFARCMMSPGLRIVSSVRSSRRWLTTSTHVTVR